jgi:NAD(P)-dependent dehydrogenase (short-subunit alcohol dehydrogenase family)
MRILIIGGNGGIGSAMLQEVVRRFPAAHVDVTYRRTRPDWCHPQVVWHQVDVSDEQEVKAFSGSTADPDWLINCVGLLHTPAKGPEKSLDALDSRFFLHNISVNTVPTLLLAKYFTPKLKRRQAPKFATISAKVGSISDNHLGGWYSYRASKAALNMLLKTMAIEWQRRLKQGVVLALHPGTTDTALSAPFHASVPPGKLFAPADVARNLVGLIARATPQDSGAFWAYDGELLPW